ncbi:hypothetical protein C8J56DRAFT_31491, partial [Mycena floridula]
LSSCVDETIRRCSTETVRRSCCHEIDALVATTVEHSLVMSVHEFPVPSVPDSPFHGVLDTNYAPDDSELDQIRALTVAPLLEIEKLDLEISRLQKARDSLQSFVSSHHALLSPIRRLSPEILQQTSGLEAVLRRHSRVLHSFFSTLII